MRCLQTTSYTSHVNPWRRGEREQKKIQRNYGWFFPNLMQTANKNV